MSGQTVCDLLPLYGSRVKGILLACAAAYPPDIYSLAFETTEFTTRLRQGRWEDSRSRDILSHYNGRIIIAMGAQDEVIPKGVTQLLREAAKHSTYIEYPEAGHKLAPWLSEHSNEQTALLEALFHSQQGAL